MWSILQQMGFAVKRQAVMEILKQLDPVGVELRKKKRLRRRTYTVPGPDYLWHIDGYDKLKPYGFSIHGCIDGYSRRIIWLKVAPTNKDPKIIASYYLKAVEELNGLPTKIRSDDGSENSIIQPIHIALRTAHQNDLSILSSYLIGTSPANQRIESLWSQFTKDRIMFWRDFFSDLSEMELVDNSLQITEECLRYCFMHLVRKDLNEFTERWNRHLIAKSKGAVLPNGRPNSLYFLPHLHETRSYRKHVNHADIAEFSDPFLGEEASDNSPEFVEFAETVLTVNGLDTGKRETITDALDLYVFLQSKIEEYKY